MKTLIGNHDMWHVAAVESCLLETLHLRADGTSCERLQRKDDFTDIDCLLGDFMLKVFVFVRRKSGLNKAVDLSHWLRVFPVGLGTRLQTWLL